MKTLLITIISVAAGFGLAFLVLSPGKTSSTTLTDSGQTQFTCGMHPQIVSDQPGYCPICGMKLTPKKGTGLAASSGITVDPTVVQNIGLTTRPVDFVDLSRAIRAFGKVAYREPDIHDVNLKVEGWVEKLYVDYTGRGVSRGQPLLELYSPMLVAAQKELLIAYGALAQEDPETQNDFKKAAYGRLANWDISPEQIDRLLESGEITRNLTLVSPVNGVVIDKEVAQGAQVMPGMNMYRIASVDRVWVLASVYEQDLPFVKIGQKAYISIPNLPGRNYSGEISYIAPFLDEKGQAEIRLEVANSGLDLKPEMYAEVTVAAEAGKPRLAVPRKAIINTGARQVAYVASTDGSYIPREVITGLVGDDDMVEILDGLATGEMVVTSGQFLLDSETRLSEVLHADLHQHDPAAAKQVGHDVAAEASKHDNKTAVMPDSASLGIYTCPMPEHHHVLKFTEGKCPECGMKLVPVESTTLDTLYVCPMPEDSVVSLKPGRCPKCNMKLIPLSITAEKKGATSSTAASPSTHEHQEDKSTSADTSKTFSGIYTCPMPVHFHILRYGAGKCSECGMNLVPVEKTENKEVYHCPMASCGVVRNQPGECSVCGMNLVKLEPGAGHDQ